MAQPPKTELMLPMAGLGESYVKALQGMVLEAQFCLPPLPVHKSLAEAEGRELDLEE